MKAEWIKAFDRIDEKDTRLWKLCLINGTVQTPLRIIRKDLIVDIAGKNYDPKTVQWLECTPDPTPSGAEVYREALEKISISRENANIIAAEALAKVGQPEEVKGEEQDELWDEFWDEASEHIDDNVFGLEQVAGSSVITKRSFEKSNSKYTITRKK